MFAGLGLITFILLVVGVAFVLESRDDQTAAFFGNLFLFAISVAIFQFAFDYPVIETVRDNPTDVLRWIGMYLGIGTCYSVARWGVFNRNARNRFRDEISHLTEDRNMQPDAARQQATKEMERSFYHGAPPPLRKHKARVSHWITFWPTSVLWFFFSDVLARAGRFIVNRLSGIYNYVGSLGWGND